MKRDRKKRCGAAAAANKSALCDVDHAHKPMRGVRLLRVLAEQKENCRAVSCGNAAGQKNVQRQRIRIKGQKKGFAYAPMGFDKEGRGREYELKKPAPGKGMLFGARAPVVGSNVKISCFKNVRRFSELQEGDQHKT